MQILIPAPAFHLPQKGRLTLYVVIPFFVAEGGKKAGKEIDYANKEPPVVYFRFNSVHSSFAATSGSTARPDTPMVSPSRF